MGPDQRRRKIRASGLRSGCSEEICMSLTQKYSNYTLVKQLSSSQIEETIDV